MTTMSNLPEELVGEILSRVPLISLRALRCTCRTWNTLSETQVFGRKEARNQFLGFTVISNRVCSLRLDIQGMLNEGDLVHLSTKQIRKLDKINMNKVFHSNGLLLCTEDRSNLVVWNPYLGETRCIPPASSNSGFDMFAFGYDKNTNNHKILRFFYVKGYPLSRFELFHFKTSSWRLLDIEPDFYLDFFDNSVSLKGNSYFIAQHNTAEFVDVLLCFDFTTERFRQPLQFPKDAKSVVLSCVREEKLAVLYKHHDTMEIWITTKIENDAVSWSKFLKVAMIPLNGFPDDFANKFKYAKSFVIDEEKKIAVVCNVSEGKPTYSHAVHIIGQDGYLKSVSIAEEKNHAFDEPLMFSSYVPSLVQLGIN